MLYIKLTRKKTHVLCIGYETLSKPTRILLQDFLFWYGERRYLNKKFRKYIIHLKSHFQSLPPVGKIVLEIFCVDLYLIYRFINTPHWYSTKI